MKLVFFYDKQSIRLNSFGGEIWVCFYNVNKGEEVLELTYVDTNSDSCATKSIYLYDSKGNVKDSYTYSYPKYERVIPGSFGEEIVGVIRQRKGLR